MFRVSAYIAFLPDAVDEMKQRLTLSCGGVNLIDHDWLVHVWACAHRTDWLFMVYGTRSVARSRDV